MAEPIIQGAQGALDIYGGIEEDRPEQIVSGLQQDAAAYVQWTQSLQQQAYNAAYDDAVAAAIEWGATVPEAQLAGQQAGEAAMSEVAGSSASETIGQWLPFIGLGLSAWDIAEHGANPYNVSALAASAFTTGVGMIGGAGAATAAGPIVGAGMAFVTAPMIISDIQGSHHAKHGRKYVEWQQPNLEEVGRDGDWVYLYDNAYNEDYVNYKYPRVYRYNTKTNELQYTTAVKTNAERYYKTKRRGHNLRDPYWDVGSPTQEFLTADEVRSLISGEGEVPTTIIRVPGNNRPFDREDNPEEVYAKHGIIERIDEDVRRWNYYRVNIDSDLVGKYGFGPYTGEFKWETFDPSQPLLHRGGEDSPIRLLFMNTPALQAQIFDLAIAPNHPELVPSVDNGWNEVTIDGRKYFEKDGLIADFAGDHAGEITGYVDPDTGEAYYIAIEGRTRIHEGEGVRDKEIEHSPIGTVENWDELKINSWNDWSNGNELEGLTGIESPNVQVSIPETQSSSPSWLSAINFADTIISGVSEVSNLIDNGSAVSGDNGGMTVDPGAYSEPFSQDQSAYIDPWQEPGSIDPTLSTIDQGQGVVDYSGGMSVNPTSTQDPWAYDQSSYVDPITIDDMDPGLSIDLGGNVIQGGGDMASADNSGNGWWDWLKGNWQDVGNLVVSGAAAFSGGDETLSGTEMTAQEPGPYPDRGYELWSLWVDGVLDGWNGQNLGELYQGRQDYLDQQFGVYGGELGTQAGILSGDINRLGQEYRGENIRARDAYLDALASAPLPYYEAQDRAKASPIRFSFGGQPVGNAMMMGGVNLAKERMSTDVNLAERGYGARRETAQGLYDTGMDVAGRRFATNMLVPEATWAWAQQSPPQSAQLQTLDDLKGTSMTLQGLRYGIPTQTTSAELDRPGPTFFERFGNFLDLATKGKSLFDKKEE